jgi:hypothetical protein
MTLVIAFEAGRDVNDSAFWWMCGDRERDDSRFCTFSDHGNAIAAPEYDWEYWWSDAPEQELNQACEEMPALKQEIEEMKQRYLNRNRRNRGEAGTAKIIVRKRRYRGMSIV